MQKLLELGLHVRVLSRDLAKARELFGNSVEVIAGDLVEVRDLKALVTGATHLLAAHGADRFSGERRYELVDYVGMDKALDSIPAGQATHIVYLSCCIVYKSALLSSTHLGQPLYWKRLTEDLVQRSGHPYTIVRPGRLNSSKSGSLQVVAEQLDLGGGYIAREDVAEVMVQAMQYENARGKTFETFNVAVLPARDWNKFFSELKADTKLV